MTKVTKIEFDGIQLSLIDQDGTLVKRVYAVSGAKYLQHHGYSDIRGYGPIPEGEYFIRHSAIESRLSIEHLNNIGWIPGWGFHRAEIFVQEGTDTLGRDGFYLHGSTLWNGYGSQGCIDLNTKDGEIFAILKERGAESIKVTVKYSNFIKEHFHPVYTVRTPIDQVRFEAAQTLRDLEKEKPDVKVRDGFQDAVKAIHGGKFLESFVNETVPPTDRSEIGGQDRGIGAAGSLMMDGRARITDGNDSHDLGENRSGASSGGGVDRKKVDGKRKRISLLEKVDPTSPHFDIQTSIAERGKLYAMARQAETSSPHSSFRHLPHGRLLMTSAPRFGEWEGGLKVPRVEKRRPTRAERMDELGAKYGAAFREARGTPLQKAVQMDFIGAYLALAADQDQRDQEQTWAQATKADPELGGQKLKRSLSLARYALDRFGDPEFYGFLDDSGLGNHPEIIRMFKRAGEAAKGERPAAPTPIQKPGWRVG